MDIEFDNYRKMQRIGMNDMDFAPQSHYIQHQPQAHYEPQQPYSITPKNFHNNGPVRKEINPNNNDYFMSNNTQNIPQNSYFQQPLTLQPSYPTNSNNLISNPPPILNNQPRSQQQPSQRQIVVVSPTQRNNMTSSPLIYEDNRHLHLQHQESVDGYDDYSINTKNISRMNNNNTLSPTRQAPIQRQYLSPPTSPSSFNNSNQQQQQQQQRQQQQHEKQQDRQRMSKFLDMLTLNLTDNELRMKMRSAGFEPSEIDHILLAQGRLSSPPPTTNNNNIANKNNSTPVQPKMNNNNMKRQISISAATPSTLQQQSQRTPATLNKVASVKTNNKTPTTPTGTTTNSNKYKPGDYNTKKYEKFTLMVGMHFHEKTIRLQMMNAGITKADCDAYFKDIQNMTIQKQQKQLKSSKSKKAVMDLSATSNNNNNNNNNNTVMNGTTNGGNGGTGTSGRRRGLSVSSSGSSLDSFFSSTGNQSSAWNRIKNMFFIGRYSDETTREGSISGDSAYGGNYSEYGGSVKNKDSERGRESSQNNTPRDSSISYYKSYGNISGKSSNNANNASGNNMRPNSNRITTTGANNNSNNNMTIMSNGFVGGSTGGNDNNKLKPYEEIDREWIAILDTASNSYYYWSKRTGMTTWEHPHTTLAVRPSESVQQQQYLDTNPLLLQSPSQSPRTGISGGSGMTRSVSGTVKGRESLGSQMAMNDYYRNVNTNHMLSPHQSPRSIGNNNGVNNNIINSNGTKANNNAMANKTMPTSPQQQQMPLQRTGTVSSITDTLPVHFPIDDEWLQILDPNRNKFYYWNTVTGVTTWTHPLTGGSGGSGKSDISANNGSNNNGYQQSSNNNNNNSTNTNNYRSGDIFATGGSSTFSNQSTRQPPPVAPRPPPPRTGTNPSASSHSGHTPTSHSALSGYTSPPSTPPSQTPVQPPAPVIIKQPAFHEKEEYTKYVKMYQMKIPEGGIRMKMKVEGVSDGDVDKFFNSLGSA